jgi:hypothetical protein
MSADIKFSPEDCQKWLSNKTINPQTNRKIKEGGGVYKSLERACEQLSSSKTISSPPKMSKKEEKMKASPIRKIGKKRSSSPSPQSSPVKNTATNNPFIIQYSEKAIAVLGDSRKYKEQLKNIGGKYNPNLTYEGKRQPGWIFPKKMIGSVKPIINFRMDKPDISITGRSFPKNKDIYIENAQKILKFLARRDKINSLSDMDSDLYYDIFGESFGFYSLNDSRLSVYFTVDPFTINSIIGYDGDYIYHYNPSIGEFIIFFDFVRNCESIRYSIETFSYIENVRVVRVKIPIKEFTRDEFTEIYNYAKYLAMEN